MCIAVNQGITSENFVSEAKDPVTHTQSSGERRTAGSKGVSQCAVGSALLPVLHLASLFLNYCLLTHDNNNRKSLVGQECLSDQRVSKEEGSRRKICRSVRRDFVSSSSSGINFFFSENASQSLAARVQKWHFCYKGIRCEEAVISSRTTYRRMRMGEMKK